MKGQESNKSIIVETGLTEERVHCWSVKFEVPNIEYSDTSANEDNSFRNHIR